MSGRDWEDWIDQQIREAQERGEFDDLPGMGKPLDLTPNPFAQERELEFKVLKETKREYWGLQAVNMLDCLAYFAMFNIAVVTLSSDWGFTGKRRQLRCRSCLYPWNRPQSIRMRLPPHSIR